MRFSKVLPGDALRGKINSAEFYNELINTIALRHPPEPKKKLNQPTPGEIEGVVPSWGTGSATDFEIYKPVGVDSPVMAEAHDYYSLDLKFKLPDNKNRWGVLMESAHQLEAGVRAKFSGVCWALVTGDPADGDFVDLDTGSHQLVFASSGIGRVLWPRTTPGDPSIITISGGGGSALVWFEGTVAAAFTANSDAQVTPVTSYFGDLPASDVTVTNGFELAASGGTKCAVIQIDDGSYRFTWLNCSTSS